MSGRNTLGFSRITGRCPAFFAALAKDTTAQVIKNKCLLKVHQNGTCAVRSYSYDSKTDDLEPLKTQQSVPFFRGGTFYTIFCEISLRWSLSSDGWKGITSLRALVWSVDDELVHVQDCTMSVFQSAWFGKKMFAAALERAKRGNCWRAQKPSVCGSDTMMTVFREIYDSRTVRMCHSGAQPQMSCFVYA